MRNEELRKILVFMLTIEASSPSKDCGKLLTILLTFKKTLMVSPTIPYLTWWRVRRVCMQNKPLNQWIWLRFVYWFRRKYPIVSSTHCMDVIRFTELLAKISELDLSCILTRELLYQISYYIHCWYFQIPKKP